MNDKTRLVEDLAQRYVAGEHYLLDQLRRQLLPLVRDYYDRKLLLAPEADDASSQLIQRLLLHGDLRKYAPQPGSTFWSWLCRVMDNDCNTLRKYLKRRPEQFDNLSLQDWFCVSHKPDQGGLRGRTQSRNPLVQVAVESFHRLSLEERDLVRLKLAGFSFAEIAAMLDREISPEELPLRQDSLRVRYFRVINQKLPKLIQATSTGREALQRVSDARRRFGCPPLPVWTYLEELARVAHSDPLLILGMFGLTKRKIALASANGIADMLHRIGVEVIEAVRAVRLGFAEVRSCAIGTAMPVLFRGAQPRWSGDEALSLAEHDYSGQDRETIYEIRKRIEGRFRQECSRTDTRNRSKFN